MAEEGEVDENLALRKELRWLLRDEAHSVLDDIGYTLKECCDCFPMSIPGGSEGRGPDVQSPEQEEGLYPSQRLLLSSATATAPGSLKCLLTLRGDSISEADICFKQKDKGKDSQSYKTTILPTKPWKIQQIQDAANHLQEAVQIISLRDRDYKFKCAQEVLLLLEEMKRSIQSCRVCLSTPKRKSLVDLVNSKTREIFNPPLPQNIALSFYIHSSKVILAIYHLHVNGQQKMDVSQRLQMDAAVEWLNDAAMLFTLALQQCQQLIDKITTVCQCGGLDQTMTIT